MTAYGFVRRHYKAFLLFSGLCIVFLALGFNAVIIPLYDKQQLVMKVKDANAVGGGWWNSSFTYYKVLNIANKNLGSQMKIRVGNNSGGNVSVGGHIKQGNYFKDVRFVNTANTTEYYHWMENCTTGTQATFWVNNSDNASSILMYYGNSACTNSTYRNPHNTFYLYSDVDDVADWVHSTKVEVSASGGYVNVVGTSANQNYYAYLPFDSPISKYCVNIKKHTNVVSTTYWGNYPELRDGDSSHIMAEWEFTFNDNNIRAYYNGGSLLLLDTTVAGTDYIFNVYMNETTGKLNYILRNADYSFIATTGLQSFLAAMTDGMDRLHIYSGTASNYNYNIEIKYVFITLWSSVDSVWSSFGGEQTYSAPSARNWQNLTSGYVKGGNITVAFKNIVSGYETGGNKTIAWDNLFSGYLTGGNKTISWKNLFSGYLTGGNKTLAWNNLLSGYMNGGNSTSLKTIFSGYLTGGNKTIPWTNLLSGYETGGNATISWKNILSGYLTGGNSTLNWNSIFSGYLTGGNATIPWTNLLSGYETGGNITNIWANIFSGWFTGSNTTSLKNIFQGYETGGNTTVSYANIFTGYITGSNGTFPWKSIVSGYLIGSNATQTWNDISSGYETGGNASTGVFNSIFSGYETGGNLTALRNIFSGFETGGNITNYQTLFSGWLVGGNFSSNITLSNPYPGNNSDHIKINVTLSITIHHLNGNQMNITWYWGNSSANATHYLGSTLNVANGTYSMAIVPANQTYTDYWWNVNVTSGSDYITAIYKFTTGIKGVAITISGQDRFTMGMIIGSMIFLLIGFILFRRKRRR